jgi:hypothetical protein
MEMDGLSASVIDIANLSDTDKCSMFELYKSNYGGAERSIFFCDLDRKDYVVLLTDCDGEVGGFSTLAVYDENFEETRVKVIFSGDTIIDKAFWGKNEFAMAWLRLAGCIKKQSPDIPLYWLLIAKGHRTYRYLSLFSKEYYPRQKVDTPTSQQRIMDYLARQQFGKYYSSETGLVQLPEPRSFLNNKLAPIPEKDKHRPGTQFFLSKNPDYVTGDELLCLCKLEPGNLRRFAREWFLEGMCA